MRAAYGHVSGMMAPKRTHAESMVQGMSYDGSIDIMHDQAGFYAGATAAEAAKKLSAADIQKRRDDHGNFVGAEANERIHYHASLKKGQNTTNVCLARVLMRCIAESNVDSSDLYTPDLYLQKMYTYMTTPPDPEDSAQLKAHNDSTWMFFYEVSLQMRPRAFLSRPVPSPNVNLGALEVSMGLS